MSTISPQGWLYDSPNSDQSSQIEETDEQLLNEAMEVIESNNQNQSASSPPQLTNTKQPICETTQITSPKASDITSNKRTREDYETDLKELDNSKTKVMKLEHELLKARYGVQTLQEAFLKNYYKSSSSNTNEYMVQKIDASIPRTSTTASTTTPTTVPTTALTSTNPSRGYSNYHAFMKICKTILPGSLRIKRSYFKALWQHQKMCLNAFFKTNKVSSADGKAMNDNDAYSNHVTTVVAPLMKQTMPYYTRMILLYDNNVTESQNLSNLSSLCALPIFIQSWTNSTMSTNQDLLECIWNTFGGLIDLQCQKQGVSSIFPETITDNSNTPLTYERLRDEIAPSIAKAMPYLQELVCEYAENITKTDIQTLVIQAKKTQSQLNLT